MRKTRKIKTMKKKRGGSMASSLSRNGRNTTKGTNAIMDRYSWSLKLTNELGKEIRTFGFVNLLR